MSKQAEYSRKWYENNRELQKQRVHDRRKKLRQWFDDHKTSLRCECGENDIRCLDFHHTRGVKVINLSEAINRGWGKERILEEVAKCDVICANCHRKETFRLATP